MKKNLTRKLNLNKTTLRALDAIQLNDVAGGLTNANSDCRFCERQINTAQDPCFG